MSPLAFLVLCLLTWATEQAPLKNTPKMSSACPCNDTLLRFTSQAGEVRPDCCDGKNANWTRSVPTTTIPAEIGQAANTLHHSSPSPNTHLPSGRHSRSKQCYLEMTNPRWILKDVSVDFIKPTNSSDWWVHVSWKPFSKWSSRWTEYYVFFTWENSQLSECFFLPKNQTSVNITSNNDPTTIFLAVVAIPRFRQNDTESIVMKAYYPPYPKNYEGTVIPTLPKKDWNTKRDSNKTVNYAAIAVGSLIGLGLAAVLFLYCLRSKKTIHLPPGYEYHAFICFNSDDSQWVKDVLLHFLEKENHLKCCVHYRDFIPGIPFVENMAKGIYKSYKTIAVLSSNFLRSSYCDYELQVATHRLAERKDRSIVVIRIDNASCNGLPTELSKRTFIDYSSSLEKASWKRKLLNFLSVDEELHGLRESRETDNDVTGETNNNFTQ